MQKFARDLIALAFLFVAAVFAAHAQSASDACSLLTPAQVSAAAGAQMGPGKYVTPTFKTTCTWTAAGKIVTLMTEGVDAYNKGKTPLSPAMQIVSASGIGDDAYYVVMAGKMVALFVRKGGNAFKMSVYSQLPVPKLEAMESALAQQVAGEL
jgi:hypothetical protein